MKPKSAKAKGKKFERQVASDLRRKRLDREAKAQPGSGAFSGFSGDINTTLSVHIECKNQETWRVLEWWGQCTNDAPASPLIRPILVMRKNRFPEPLALMRWEDILDLLKTEQEYLADV